MKTSVGWLFCAGALMASISPMPSALAQTAPASKPLASHARGVVVVPADVQDPGEAAKAVVPIDHSIMRTCNRPNASWDLAFSGQSDFDRSLSSALKAGKAVVVNLASPYDEKSAPPGPIAPWLSEVKGAGGVIAVSAYCTSSRGIGGNWFTDLVQHITGSIYRPARNFDATLFADETKHVITQIAFVPKGRAVAAN